MFDIRNVATEGFDRAINAMRREHGGREASDSGWRPAECEDFERAAEFVIGPDDHAECLRLLKVGDYDFLKFIAVWAHIEAPAEWWAVFGGYFIAQSDVEKKGESVTRSVMTNYGHLRNLMDEHAENADDWQSWATLINEAAKLPESWMLLENLEVS